MKIMVIGSGGREHAIIRKLKENPEVTEIFALPGNGGIAYDATCVNIKACDIPAIVSFAAEKAIDYAVVAPDDPLVAGLVDALEEKGVPCFGPRKNAAIIEGSKAFAKDLMKKYGIPTAEYRIFSDASEALAYVETCPIPTVIKADGLALGKGVIIAQTRDEAKEAVKEIMQDGRFGKSGDTVVIEEFLSGPEVSVLSFTDGKTVIPMISSMDHKRAGDGDSGLNTGGMGTIAPNPFYTKEIADECMERIFLPTVRAMSAEGRPFKGCLYFGLMLTADGPKVIEYNCRFGDPETQVVLPLLKSDLLTVMRAVTDETLDSCPVEFSDESACCVIMASEGYPLSYEKGFEINVPEDVRDSVYFAGAALAGADRTADGTASDRKLLTAGGRVLGAIATAPSLSGAIREAYRKVGRISFGNAFYRHDIGARALKVFRIFVEKKPSLAGEAKALLSDARSLLGINTLKNVRIFNRYDAQNITAELFNYAVNTVFSEPQLDITYDALPDAGADGTTFAVEYLPGQFDQRADSAAQCIQLISCKERPLIRSAKVYMLTGSLTSEQLDEIKKYVINPVEAREASLDCPKTLETVCGEPSSVAVLDGFISMPDDKLADFISEYSLAMDEADLAFCRDYFISEKRNPTITEIRMIDTYWSDHCRHTTFGTIIDDVTFEDSLLQDTYSDYLKCRERLGRTKPVCLMDLATIAVKDLKARGLLDRLDESEEINACTVKMTVTVDGKEEPWLLLFKNETHNHPTEIEPFGGAATCIGGAIRDPLSGRAYVYGAMRVTGAGDPTAPVSETIPGKLPQRKLVTTAAAGYSSYGNQIGLATGIVDEIYHPGYAAKRMEIGAVIAAAPCENVIRETPAPGDVVILLGGSTGRDGIGGATGSSKAHNVHSVETCGAEVQKGNAPEERKLQRLFRNPEASRLIIRCNDFGAGGVSVAVGELADGLSINLDAVPKKYEGLDGTELAISESQERMAVVVRGSGSSVQDFLELAGKENLQAVPIAVVKKDPRLTMTWRGETIVDVSREFLNSNGAPKHISVKVGKSALYSRDVTGTFAENLAAMAGDLNICSKRGLSERFDSTIGAGTVLMPFGGKYQLTPIQAMVQKVSLENGHTDDCSMMSWGYIPAVSEKSPYHGAYMAVAESVAKLIATGADYRDIYLTFQEYFEKPGRDPERWGKPLAALLGAYRAQSELKIAAIGGKDSMSGSFEKLDVPPTLVSFAVTTQKVQRIISPEFKKAGSTAVFLEPASGADGLPVGAALIDLYRGVAALIKSGCAVSCYACGFGGIAEAVYKMSIGNGFGFRFDPALSVPELFSYRAGGFVLELEGAVPEDSDLNAEHSAVEVRSILEHVGISSASYSLSVLGNTCSEPVFALGSETVKARDINSIYEGRLEPVYSCNIPSVGGEIPTYSYTEGRAAGLKKPAAPAVPGAAPRVLIPVFPGTNCEYDSARAVRDAGAEAEIFVINNLSAENISRSIDEFAARIRHSQMIFIPGGFSGGDEPDGSGKFITAVFRNEAVKDAVTSLLDERGGLMCGICNGFQALIKLGLVPFGRIIDTDADCPTLTFNTIARHQSKLVRTRIASTKSPWLSLMNVGDIVTVPISHGEGRFLANKETILKLEKNGQIATQYVDLNGRPTDDVRYNPNNSMFAIEGITSPDGRVFGKMGHSERIGDGLYRNVPGTFDIRMFEAAVRFFKE